MTALRRMPVPEPPGPGQESVWDYPRPPRLERSHAVVGVVLGRTTVARTDAALRVLRRLGDVPGERAVQGRPRLLRLVTRPQVLADPAGRGAFHPRLIATTRQPKHTTAAGPATTARCRPASSPATATPAPTRAGVA